MKSEDKEAFDWWWHRVANHSTVRPSETWQAACLFKQKEIDKLQAENATLRECIKFYTETTNNPKQYMRQGNICRWLKELEDK